MCWTMLETAGAGPGNIENMQAMNRLAEVHEAENVKARCLSVAKLARRGNKARAEVY